MFLKVTDRERNEMYINMDNIKFLTPVEYGTRTLIVFIDGDKLLVEESIEDLLEDE